MIQLENLYFGYKRNKPIFQNLSLELQPGFIYGLLGKNGAGKSTLLKQISGMANPFQGNVNVFGHKASDRHPEMLQDIFVIPEEFDLPPISIETYAKITGPFYSRFSMDQLNAYLVEFDLAKEAKVSTLS
ncbi:MAG: ATP-binding cassette domain-containing protein, partial [Bacteroidota bacterium]|nr:ATP-binding cassette domain-containing protein [Bacteroidota bacterium]